MAQAQAAKGNISASARTVAGIEHTLTIWESRQEMLTYLRQGAHLQAMKASRSMGSYGKVHGYETDTIPSWDEALVTWAKHGRVVLGKPKPGDKGYESTSKTTAPPVVATTTVN